MFHLAISKQADECHVALLENEVLLEYYRYHEHDQEALGDIKLGQIVQIVEGINAAFVNIGKKKPAFMPLPKELLTAYHCGQELPVQLQKAPNGEKAEEVTPFWSLHASCIVITPYNAKLGVSAKITDAAERERLKNILMPLWEEGGGNQGFGYILRTESLDKSASFLIAQAEGLRDRCQEIQQRARYSRIGDTLYSAGSPISKFIQCFPVTSLSKISVDDTALLRTLKEEIRMIAPEYEPKFTAYQDKTWNLWDFLKISSQLQKALQKQIFLPDGGYLYIEETEALSVIDVNSGKQPKEKLSGKEKMTAITAVNLKAVPVIAQQIRLRNLSGIIIIDFINMQRREDREMILAALTDALSQDPRRSQVLGFTRLGLVEISRERKEVSLAKRL